MVAPQKRAKPTVKDDPISRAVMSVSLTLNSFEAQKVFKNTFKVTGNHIYNIGIMSRIAGNQAAAEEAERQIQELFAKLRGDIQAEHDRLKLLVDAAAIDFTLNYEHPLAVSANIVAPTVNQYLRIIVQLDELMRLCDTLWHGGEFTEAQKVECGYLWQRRVTKLHNVIRNLHDLLRKKGKEKLAGAAEAEDAAKGRDPAPASNSGSPPVTTGEADTSPSPPEVAAQSPESPIETAVATGIETEVQPVAAVASA